MEYQSHKLFIEILLVAIFLTILFGAFAIFKNAALSKNKVPQKIELKETP